MLKPCEGKLSWYKRNVFSELRTDAEQSYLMKIDLNNSGRFSRLWIQSVDTKGNPKSVGGDSWRVYVRNGPTSIAPIILDKNNGVYEVMMLIMEPGIYQANIFLDYSLCDGLREPPDFWFINGTDHGTYHHPQEGVLGNIERDYIQSCLGGQTKYEFEIKPNLDSLVDNDYVKSHRSGTLWVYGDSLGMRFIDSAQSRPLCTKIFSICESTYNWIYEVKEKRNPLKIQTKFNKTIILNKIQNILQRQDMNQPSSVFMFSFGVHFPISLRLEEFKDLIDSVILLVSKRINGTKIFKGIPIWKTTAAFEKEKINRTPWPNKPHNFTMFRFLTTQVVGKSDQPRILSTYFAIEARRDERGETHNCPLRQHRRVLTQRYHPVVLLAKLRRKNSKVHVHSTDHGEC
ncbi:hypothetical protein AC249_AIPGENE14290 [Exaiptasia diaphana]|nr:hypothetical protein AC249_AIPGENE14290 [Exaiptasia diaphana]